MAPLGTLHIKRDLLILYILRPNKSAPRPSYALANNPRYIPARPIGFNRRVAGRLYLPLMRNIQAHHFLSGHRPPLHASDGGKISTSKACPTRGRHSALDYRIGKEPTKKPYQIAQ